MYSLYLAWVYELLTNGLDWIDAGASRRRPFEASMFLVDAWKLALLMEVLMRGSLPAFFLGIELCDYLFVCSG